MVDLLNNFSNSCSHRLFLFDRKINKIEAELRLLEIKLNSIPGLEEKKTSPVAAPSVRTDTDSSQPTVKSEVEVPTTEEQPVEVKDEAEVIPEINPEIAKYLKMVHVGVPVPAVKLKMQAEGLDPNLLKM